MTVAGAGCRPFFVPVVLRLAVLSMTGTRPSLAYERPAETY
jgi:hypothetical protein